MTSPSSGREARRWWIDRIAPDFTLLDVWTLPVEGGPDDRDAALELLTSFDPAHAECVAVRGLFRLRFLLGAWLGWDHPAEKLPIPGCAETTLAARLPEHLRHSADGSAIGAPLRASGGGFTPLYRTRDEWAAEISNATVHGVLHLAWVEEGKGRHRGRMAVYVKPRGRLGEIYLMLIQPFRHLVVYPALLRQIGRAWDARSRSEVLAETGGRVADRSRHAPDDPEAVAPSARARGDVVPSPVVPDRSGP